MLPDRRAGTPRQHGRGLPSPRWGNLLANLPEFILGTAEIFRNLHRSSRSGFAMSAFALTAITPDLGIGIQSMTRADFAVHCFGTSQNPTLA
jgi:hypothetical protein